MLTRKKELFCKHYLKNGFNGPKAVKDSGHVGKSSTYNNSKAWKLLQEPEIRAYIDKYKKIIDDKLDAEILINQKQLLEYLSNCIRGTETEEIIITSKDGYNLIETQIKQADRLKAAQMIFKYYNMDIKKVDEDINNNITINNNIIQLPEEEEIEAISEKEDQDEN